MEWFDYTVLLIAMLFMHIIADYNLQGCLADMKQKEWWEKNYPDKKYKYDYIMALIMHSIQWSVCIMLPLFMYMLIITNLVSDVTLILMIGWTITNIVVHAIVDDLKANKHILNLIQDQLIHIIQIAITWFFIAPGLIR